MAGGNVCVCARCRLYVSPARRQTVARRNAARRQTSACPPPQWSGWQTCVREEDDGRAALTQCSPSVELQGRRLPQRRSEQLAGDNP